MLLAIYSQETLDTQVAGRQELKLLIFVNVYCIVSDVGWNTADNFWVATFHILRD